MRMLPPPPASQRLGERDSSFSAESTQEVLLENVGLILEAFDYLRLPFAFRQGRVGKLSIKIPWKKLGWILGDGDSGTRMPLKEENMLAKRPNLLQQNLQSYRGEYVVSILKSKFMAWLVEFV
ncbi:hypothetical protein PHJA_002461300 [Phtheirospermum japonicum]|uniref:Chorein N-terminal domain-containing protein n=1 Tax=Phtheirospermum japonicum TaxID=374723 RepID=A0A830D3X3_9LAMI|nr:hypothetical protein PHJA_002461300 [Phtheirospermum japonicum]